MDPRTPLAKALKRINNLGGAMVSSPSISWEDLQVRCAAGHIWVAPISELAKPCGLWCPECRSPYHEPSYGVSHYGGRPAAQSRPASQSRPATDANGMTTEDYVELARLWSRKNREELGVVGKEDELGVVGEEDEDIDLSLF
jgi:hypothetical protein